MYFQDIVKIEYASAELHEMEIILFASEKILNLYHMEAVIPRT